MADQRKKIDVKVKLLDYATKDMDKILERKHDRELREKQKILEKTLEDIDSLKYGVIEEMITKDTSPDELDQWTNQLQQNLDPFYTIVTGIKEALSQLSKLDLAAKPNKDESKRDVKMHAKLPKLQIAAFNGTHIDWFRFWSQFKAEIDGSAIAPVTKFSYMRDMLPKQSLTLINGLPFTGEGYERAKTILQTKYGKTSEVINAHIQRIMALPVINESNSSRIHDFYETLVNSVQSLETMGKLAQIEGYVRMTLDKLSGIRSDLVRLDKDWHEWDFATFVSALGEWTERNPREDLRQSPFHGTHKKTVDKSFTTRAEVRRCVYCTGDHKPTQCTKVKDTAERRRILKSKQCCFNCTRCDHRASECKSRSCMECNGRHHTSICEKNNTKKEPGLTGSTAGESVNYPVVQVKVNGIKCWALLDSGAGSNYISTTLTKMLKQTPKRIEQRKIEMLMSSTSTKVNIYKVDIQNLASNFSLTCEASRVPKDVLLKLSNPDYRRLKETYAHLREVNFNSEDRRDEIPIHLIIGIDVYCKIKMKKEPKLGQPGQPVAELTKFGWVVMSPGEEIDTKTYLTQSATDYDDLCRLDVLGIEDTADGDQGPVYSEFKEQLRRDPEGWYETGLMWKTNKDELPTNKAASLRRMNTVLNKLKREPTQLEEYHAKILEQIEEGIVEPAPTEVQGREYYIPHKPVRKEGAETTKLRIVYDASARPNDTSPSLNDCLETGPLLMNHLWTILTRNRMRPVAITGDIKQAFHQIRIREEDRDALRFHWINDTSTCSTTVLRFTRAVMGLVQSPFLLNGTLDCHFNNYDEEPHEVVQAMKEDLYVDDLVKGANTVSEAKQLKDTAVKVLGDAKFQLHKWHSNVKEIEDNDKKSDETAILGVPWHKNTDSLAVKFPKLDVDNSKRGILKYLASIYDPLGIASPITLLGKIIYRKVCDDKLGWDQPLTKELHKEWKRWLSRLPTMIEVPRSIPRQKEEIEEIILHVFGDASKEGTSASVYAVVKQVGAVSQALLCSNSRLSKKRLTIPRLELVSAHMGTNLMKNVRQALARFPVVKEVAWSDSTATLHWIKGDGQYKEFVRNRVTKIKEKKGICWRYVDTKQNPTDIGSRGCHGDKLSKLWLEGPTWLQNEEDWPEDITTKPTTETEEESKKIKDVLATAVKCTENPWNLISKFPLWKVLRITSWIQRFVTNCRRRKQGRIKGPIQTTEIESSKLLWIHQIQANHEMTEKFAQDKERLNLQKDHEGTYICMGRVEGDYPVYLPTDDLFSEKLVEHLHKKTLHGGVGFTMTEVRRHYWIPKLRQMTKSITHRCHGCKRFHAIAFARPRTGNLPTDRTVGHRPFQVIGLDFAGPFTYLNGMKEECKTYILLYTCSLTRAVYLDVLNDQTFEGILMSFKALIARRTRPEKIYSDNFSSFQALAKWLKQVMAEEKLHSFLANQSMKWQFNLSRAPWWGGQFERLVGLMKQTIWKSIGKTKPRLEEFKALMLDVETTINNRPLGYIEDDVQSTVLTPNVMMFDYPVNIPHLENIKDDLEVTIDLKKRYKYLKHAREKIWQRWSDEYLKYLRERHNLTHKQKETKFHEGDVVIIKGDERNRAHWNLGIIDKLMPGKDGIVRAIRLRAGKSHLERSPEHLYPLELACEPKRPVNTDQEPPQRPRRNANAIARLLIQDQANEEGNVPLVE